MPIAAPTMPSSLIGASKQRLLPYFCLQALGAAEHAAEIADILAEHDDVVVAPHRHVHGVADRLDHGHAGHGSDSRLLALAAQMRRHLGIDAFEHVAHRRLAAGMQRAVAFGLLLRRDHRVQDLRLGLLVALLRPDAALTIRWFFSRITGSPSGQASDSVFGR